MIGAAVLSSSYPRATVGTVLYCRTDDAIAPPARRSICWIDISQSVIFQYLPKCRSLRSTTTSTCHSSSTTFSFLLLHLDFLSFLYEHFLRSLISSTSRIIIRSSDSQSLLRHYLLHLVRVQPEVPTPVQDIQDKNTDIDSHCPFNALLYGHDQTHKGS